MIAQEKECCKGKVGFITMLTHWCPSEQVSISGQALVFVVRTERVWFLSRAGLLTYAAFFIAQVIIFYYAVQAFTCCKAKLVQVNSVEDFVAPERPSTSQGCKHFHSGLRK